MLFSYTGTPTSAPSVWPNSGSKKEWHSHPDARLLVHASPGVSEDDADDTLNLIGIRFVVLVLIRSSTVLRSVPPHAELHGWGGMHCLGRALWWFWWWMGGGGVEGWHDPKEGWNGNRWIGSNIWRLVFLTTNSVCISLCPEEEERNRLHPCQPRIEFRIRNGTGDQDRTKDVFHATLEDNESS